MGGILFPRTSSTIKITVGPLTSVRAEAFAHLSFYFISFQQNVIFELQINYPAFELQINGCIAHQNHIELAGMETKKILPFISSFAAYKKLPCNHPDY
jgi:hypothetical protein